MATQHLLLQWCVVLLELAVMTWWRASPGYRAIKTSPLGTFPGNANKRQQRLALCGARMNRKGARPKKPPVTVINKGGLPYNRSSPWKAAVGMAFDDGL